MKGKTVFFVAVLLLMAMGGISQAFSAPDLMKTKEEGQAERLKTALSRVSIPFIENQGQTDGKVAFYARTFGGTLFVTKDGELAYSLPKYEKDETGKAESAGGVALKERLIGSKPVNLKGESLSQTKVNYFIGKDPSKWKSSINTYEIVSLGEVYEGIELKLKAYGRNAEKLFYIGPYGEPSKIALAIEGAESLKTDPRTGDLIAETALGEIRFTRPVAFYKDNPKKKIEVSYEVKDNTYTFALAKYDRTKTIVIDPLLASTFIGGSSEEYGYSMALDSAGSVYVTGETVSSDYPTTTGAYDTQCGTDGTCNDGSFDVFVSKLNSDLSSLLASTFIGGSGDDGGYSIAIDSSENVYVTGYTDSSDYPTTTGAYDTDHNGGYDDVSGHWGLLP